MTTLAQRAEAEIANSLLSYLRGKLQNPTLTYSQAPKKITGGFDTQIFGFRLAGAPEELSGPLVVRVFRKSTDPEHALWERAVHTGIVELGFPAPSVFLAEARAEMLGSAFVVMERLPGRIMLDMFFRPSRLFFRLSRILAELHLRLHALDTTAFSTTLDREGFPAAQLSVERWNRQVLGEVLDQLPLDGLRPGLDWLSEHRPPDPARLSICHGDFHPLNILIDRGEVSGVIDWDSVRIADPAYDIGATRALFAHGPIDLPRLFQGPVNAVRRMLVRRYTSTYREQRPLDDERIAYYEAMRCLGFLIEGSEHLLADGGVIERPDKHTAFASRRALEDIAAHFHELTGVEVRLPAQPEPVSRS
ncbi:MAG: phosphotransferase [Dehalococcoidia bacterium]